MATLEVTRLRSSDGFLFEVPLEVACLSPIVAELLDLHDDDDEVPLPMVRGIVLGEILDLCKHHVNKGFWDTTALKRIGQDSQQLQQLAWSADYMGLEELMDLCLAHLGEFVVASPLEKALVSVSALRRILQLRARSLATSEESTQTMALLEALATQAPHGDLDSVAVVHLYLHDRLPAIRKAATAAVGRLAPTDHAKTIEHLRRHMSDLETSVQLAALIAIAQVSARGNQQVLDLMKQKSMEGDAATRGAATEAIGHVAMPGDAQVVAHVKQGMSDSNGNVRKAAVEAYARLSKQGDTHAALILIKCLEDMDETVRQAAIQAAVAMIHKDNDTAIRALCERLEHRYWWVSWAAAKVLGEVAPTDKPHIVDAVVSRLGHASPSTRQTALQTLSMVASKGNSRVIQALKTYLQHEDSGVRKVAVKAMSQFGRGEDSAIKITGALLESGRKSVRKSAVEALKLVATHGNELAQQELCRRVGHRKPEVRLAALSTIMHVGCRNELWVIEAICQAMLDRDHTVQDAAGTAFDKMVDKGQPHAIFTLLGVHGLSGDDHVLRTALHDLPKIAGFSKRSLELVSALLARQSTTVKSAVFNTFMQMTNENYQPCVLAACCCWMPERLRSAIELPVPFETADAGVCIATQALSTCLLQPETSLPDAIAAALQTVGTCSKTVVEELSACMNSPRWFIRWRTVEVLCRGALAAKSGLKTHATTSAKVARRSKIDIENQSPNARDRLHRPGCPCLAARFDKFSRKDSSTSLKAKRPALDKLCRQDSSTHLKTVRPRRVQEPERPAKRARFAGA